MKGRAENISYGKTVLLCDPMHFAILEAPKIHIKVPHLNVSRSYRRVPVRVVPNERSSRFHSKVPLKKNLRPSQVPHKDSPGSHI